MCLQLPLFPTVGKGEFNPETAASAWLGFHSHFAPHALDHLADDSQADSRALVSVVELLKHSEQFRLGMLRNPDAFVRDPYFRGIVALLRMNADFWLDPRRDKLHGIAEEIGKTLGQKRIVA